MKYCSGWESQNISLFVDFIFMYKQHKNHGWVGWQIVITYHIKTQRLYQRYVQQVLKARFMLISWHWSITHLIRITSPVHCVGVNCAELVPAPAALPFHRGHTEGTIFSPILIVKDDPESGPPHACHKCIVINLLELFILLVKANRVSLSTELKEQE